MNFVKFPVASTVIFPMANSKTGTQLLTEWNMRSRESVANHSNIPYICGPSYTHSLNDFLINTNGSATSSTLYISGGAAIVSGHFVHLENRSNTAIAIDMTTTGLSGTLCVGLRAMYANTGTVSASIQIENSSNFYTGIQVVILPKSQFFLPENNNTVDRQGNPIYTPESQITAHLKLGEFTYYNGVITNVFPNNSRHQCLDADKIYNIDSLLASKYVTKNNLDPEKLYIMAGKAKDYESGTWKDYWTDATGSEMIWDSNPQTRSKQDTVKKIWLKDGSVSGGVLLEESAFRYDSDTDTTKLVVPHKQVDGMKTTDGVEKYYVPKEYELPTANRATGRGGVLDSRWVNFLNGLDDKIATMYRMPGGKMRKFIPSLTDKSQLPAPPIGYYTEQTRQAAYYDNRLQYSFNLLQTQVAQLNTKFLEFQTKLENEWKTAVTQDVTANMSEPLSTLQSNVDALRKDLSNFQGDISGLTSDIRQSSEEFNSQVSAYRALTDRVTNLENKWVSTTPTEEDTDTTQNKAIADLQDRVSKLSTSVTDINSAVTNLINNTSSSLNTLYQSLYGANRDGSGGDIKDTTTAINQLRSQYDYLYDAIHDLYDGITAEVEKATSTLYSQLFAELRKNLESQIAAIADQYNVTAEWSPGDYVLVAQDQTVTSTTTEDSNTFPSTMYVVVPGMTPLDSKYVASYYDVYFTDLSTPINRVNSSSSTSQSDVYSEALDTYNQAVATIKRQVPAKFVYGYELGGNDVQELSSEEDLPDVYNSTVMIDQLYESSTMIEGVRGTPGKDYFVLRYRYPIGSPTNSYTDEISGKTYDNVQCQVYRWASVFFTLNLVNDKVELDVDNPIILSGGTPYAEEARVGGFLNVGSDVYGAGYVSRDDEGHLRLNDFELLVAGVTAYQLGEDRSEGSGLDITELQDVFDQYINQRIAFPNDAQLYRAAEKGLRTDVITIDLNIGSTSEGTLNIYDIDSRFNTSVHLKITGSATKNVLINIKNCQRLRISMDETSAPTIVLDNVCLYYDADILDRVSQISGLSLWYNRFEDTDPPLEVDGMTVIYQGKLEPKGTERFWTYTSGNDNSYAYALRQITFGSDGTIIGMGVAVTDNTTNNVIPVGESIFASTFTLPQSIGLAYPVSRLTKQIKVTGNFITAYRSSDGYSVKNTNFTILTQKYLKYTEVKEFIQGVISFYTKTTLVADVSGVDQDSLMALSDQFAIDGWESGAYHIFYGGAIE